MLWVDVSGRGLVRHNAWGAWGRDVGRGAFAWRRIGSVVNVALPSCACVDLTLAQLWRRQASFWEFLGATFGCVGLTGAFRVPLDVELGEREFGRGCGWRDLACQLRKYPKFNPRLSCRN